VGVEEQSAINDIIIFPNPANSSVTITLTEAQSIVAIYNIWGELVWNKTLAAGAQTLELADFPSGIYCVQIANSTSIITQRLTISR